MMILIILVGLILSTLIKNTMTQKDPPSSPVFTPWFYLSNWIQHHHKCNQLCNQQWLQHHQLQRTVTNNMWMQHHHQCRSLMSQCNQRCNQQWLQHHQQTACECSTIIIATIDATQSKTKHDKQQWYVKVATIASFFQHGHKQEQDMKALPILVSHVPTPTQIR